MSNNAQNQELITKKLSSLAVASVVLGILGSATLLIIGGLLLLGAGAVLGHLALHDIRSPESGHSGKRLAQVGLVICYLGMFTFPLIGAISLASFPAIKEFQKAKLSANSEISKNAAAQLYRACEQYSRANGGRYPQEWSQLSGAFLGAKDIENLLTSPHSGAVGEAFQLVSHERPVLPALASSVVVIEEAAPATTKKVAIVYASGQVDLIENPNRF